MSEYYKSWPDGRSYFATLTVVGWIDLFTRRKCAEIVVQNLNACIARKGLEVWAWVLMPSHLHLIAGVAAGQRLSDVIRDFKSFTARALLAELADNQEESRREWLDHMFKYYGRNAGQRHQVWQPGGHYIALDSEARALRTRDYIHQNPVVAGMVYEASHYAYSSACPEAQVALADW
jgi:putative transposase